MVGKMTAQEVRTVNENYAEKYGFSVEDAPLIKFDQGLSEETVKKITELKEEPGWMRERRLQALKIFFGKPMPEWGGDLKDINFDEVTYYLKSSERVEDDWEKVPENIKRTFERLGIPEAERKFLAGVGAQFESNAVYHKIRDDLAKQGVIFCDMDTAVKEHPELVKEFFGKIVPAGDNKFSALNTACWSGGSFIYVPKGVKVAAPLQAYFRINAKNMGQFERTLIVADEGADVTYYETCTSPVYSSDSLHAAVVELVAKKNSKIRYVTMQNWSTNVYNLVTKRAFAYENARVEWLDLNSGCLTGNSKIFTNNDVKEIKDIEKEDVVYSLDENLKFVRKKVLEKIYSGKKEVFKLETRNRREILATVNHPFLALQKTGKYNSLSWKPLEFLKEGDLIAVSGSIPDFGKSYKLPNFPKIPRIKTKINKVEETNSDLMWLLGFYIGDGYPDKSRICFSLTKKDKSYERLTETIRRLFGIQKLKQDKNALLRVNSKLLMEWILSLGFKGRANQKKVPGWVFTLPKDQKREFINGYIDADGYVRKGHKNKSITSSNKELLESIKTLSMTCDIEPMKISKWTARQKKPLGKEEKEYTHYFLYFGEKKLEDSLYFMPISSIKSMGIQDTWDIEVEGAHNFIANGIIVHNSKLTMKYPSVYLMERNAKADILSVAFASRGQHQDAGGKVVHLAPNTTSRIVSKSVSKDGGRASYRGLLKVGKGATGVKSTVRCDALMLDDKSRSDTYPTMIVDEKDATISHEAKVGKIGEDQLFYLMSRGFSEADANAMVVLGFIADFTKELPMEYAVELNKLIRLEMDGSLC